MRAHRAYLAGFGTSGSLLAGAAALFVVASAIIAFHGWPQIATGPATTNVSAPSNPAPSRAARRLAAAANRRLVALRRAGGVGPVGPATVGGRTPSGAPTGGVAPSGGTLSPSGASKPEPPGVSVSSCPGGACAASGSQGVVAELTSTVAQDVSSIGTRVSAGLTQAASAVADQLGGTSPQAASTVQQAGSGAGGTVSSAAGTAANAIARAGSGH